MRVAIFDFDGTIYKHETFNVMMNHLKHHPHIKGYNKFFLSILPIYIGYKLKVYPEDKMKSEMMRRYLNVFRGFSHSDIFEYFLEVAEDMQKDFNEKVISRMDKHEKNGLHIMIVSGAFTPFLKATVGHLPADQLIGTDIPFKNTILPQKFTIQHIQGERKTKAIHQALKDNEIDWKNSFAYGDSISDLPVLELVGHPVAVRPEEKLEEIARHRQWDII